MNKLLLVCFLAVIAATSASHFRFYTAQWNANGLTVDFTIFGAWRLDAYCSCGNCVGASTTVSNHQWGDGSSFSHTLTWTSEDCAENWVEGNQMIQHTYGSAGTYTLLFSGCCRISSLQNSNDEDWFEQTTIYVAPGFNHAGASISLLPIEPANKNSLYTRDLTTISAVPAGASNIVYSQGTDCGAPVQIPNLSVTPAGILEWDPRALNSGLWTACVYLSYTLNNQNFRIVVDWIFETVIAQSNPPVWDEPPTLADGTVIQGTAGSPINFRMQASDPDVGDTVTVTGTGIPQGATLTASPGNPGWVDFSWTPGPQDQGLHTLSFSGSDGNNGFTPTRGVTITVDALAGGGDCDDSQDVVLGSSTAGVSSTGPCVEMCWVAGP